METAISRDERQEKFLEAFVERRGNLDSARKDVNITRSVFYRWLRDDKVFRERYDAYRVILVADIEGEAVTRVLSPEGQRGSDALITTLLKGLNPSRYREDSKTSAPVSIIYISALRDSQRPGTVPLPEAPPELPPSVPTTEAEWTRIDGPDKDDQD